tara:strand:+ start:1726 stop:2412 length:687 start_codon:yes stop_codon:yes gene_type:complete
MTFSALNNECSDFSKSIHQAALEPHLEEEALNQLCDTSRYYNFGGLCTNLIRLPKARKRLGVSSQVKLIAVIDFPFGGLPTSLKKKEAEWAASHGAEELDIVPNLFALSQGETNLFAEEIADLCGLDLPVRVILDLSQLSKTTLSLAIEASIEAGVYGIQTGNGFGPGVSKKQVQEITELIKGRCSIKAVGGIKTINHAIDLIEAGANHLGTSSGTKLINELRQLNKQ